MHLTWPTFRTYRQVAARSQPHVVATGDSYVALHHGPGYQSFAGPINIANALLGQPFGFSHDDNLGVSGLTSDQILERLPDALALRPDLLMISAGSNDVLAHGDPAATGRALSAMAAACAEAGIATVFLAVPPRSPAQWPTRDQQAHAMAANLHLHALAGTHAGISVCDWAAGNVMPGSGYLAWPDKTHDGTHFSNAGAYTAGQALAAWLQESGAMAAGARNCDLAAALTPNAELRTAGGWAGDGVVGTIASGWRLRSLQGDAAAIAALSGTGQDIVLMPGAADSAFLFETDPAVFAAGLRPGMRLRAFAEVNLTGGAPWSHVFLDLVEDEHPANRQLALYPAPGTGRVTWETDTTLSILTDPIELTGQSGVRLRLRFGIGANAAATARLHLGCIGLRQA